MQTTNRWPIEPNKRRPWNKGKLIGPKPPLQPRHVWAIRTRLQMDGRVRDLALFNLAIDSKLRACDVVSLKVDDVAPHAMRLSGRRSGKARQADPSSSRSPSRPARQSMTTSKLAMWSPASSCSPAVEVESVVSRPGNMPAWYRPRSQASVWTRHCSARTRCGEPRRP